MTKTFKDIIAWQKAHEYCLYVYKIANGFPDFEKYGLKSQFTRAAMSIASNIAEGYGKLSQSDKLRFFNIAQGSLDECRNYNIFSKDLEYITPEEFEHLEYLINGTSKFLNSYCEAIINNKAMEADVSLGNNKGIVPITSL